MARILLGGRGCTALSDPVNARMPEKTEGEKERISEALNAQTGKTAGRRNFLRRRGISHRANKAKRKKKVGRRVTML